MKAAIESKCMQVFEDPKEGFLVDVVGILRRPQKVQGKPKDTLVVQAHEFFERARVAMLSGPDQSRFIHLNRRCGHPRIHGFHVPCNNRIDGPYTEMSR